MAEDRTTANRFFDGLDTQGIGYVRKNVAIPFMRSSHLSEDDLEHIWNLADVNRDGKLTREAFVVVIRLIKAKVSGRDLPDVLPPSLIPDSTREPSSSVQVPEEPPRDLWVPDEPPPAYSA